MSNISNEQKNMAKVLAITSGKGGVGKTNIAIALSMMLAEKGLSISLLDADLGLANIDVMLNLRPLRNLEHVIKDEADLKDIIIKGPNNINIIPAASGVKMMSNLSPRQNISLIHAFEDINTMSDMLVIDTAAGISDSVIQFCNAADDILVVVCNEPASITDAYATIKVLHQEHQIHRFRIIVNKVHDQYEGKEVFQRLLTVSQRYLDVNLHLMGVIPFDTCFTRAAQNRKPLVSAYPSSHAVTAFKNLADAADKLPRRELANGRLEFFLSQKLQFEPNRLRRAGL